MSNTLNIPYNVQFRDISGNVNSSGVVSAKSPRNAIDMVCSGVNKAIANVVKYGSWMELRRASLAQGGRHTLCEVSRAGGGRSNYYIIYFRGF